MLAYALVFAQVILGAANWRGPHTEPYVEADGFVVMEAERTPHRAGWTLRDQYTGNQARADSAGAPLTFDLALAEAGAFSLWVLGREGSIGDGPATVRLDGAPVAEVAFEGRALRWTEAADGARIEIGEPGAHRLSFVAPAGMAIDKIVLARDDAYAPEGTGPPETTSVDVEVVASGPRPDVVLPPAWAFGVLYGGYTDQDESVARVERLVAGDYPIDAYWVDSWFWDYTGEGEGPGGYVDFVGDTTAYYDLDAFWGTLEDHGVKAGIWIWNTILEKGNAATFEEFRAGGHCDTVYVNTSGWHNEGSDSPTCDIAFQEPETVDYWQAKLAPFFEAGLDFLKLDRNGDVPFSRAAFEATQTMGRETAGRGFILAHLHFTDNPDFVKYPAKWTGDAKSAWAQPDYPDYGQYAMGAFREHVEMFANPRLPTYEIPFLSHDTGGYNYYGSTDVGDALYMRWAQFASFAPLMHVFTTYKNPTANMPYNFGPRAQATFREYARLRMELFPYRYSLAHHLRLAGERMTYGSAERPHQVHLGPAFMVVPVTEPGAVTQEVAFPEGDAWIDYWTHEAYDGGTTATVDAPMDRLPLFVRAGSVIPMRPYARSIEGGSNDTLVVDLYPHGGVGGTFTLVEDDGTSPAYADGALGRTTIALEAGPEGYAVEVGAMEGTFDGAPAERVYTLVLNGVDAPRAVTVGGAASVERLAEAESAAALDGAGWAYDADARVATVTFAAPTDAARFVSVTTTP